MFHLPPGLNMKIDTEGGGIIRPAGRRKTLRECRPTIFLEIAAQNLGSYPYDAKDVFDFFESYLYDLCLLGGQKLDYGAY